MVLPVAPVFDRVRLVPRPTDFLDRNTGSSGEIFYEKDTKTLRVYNGLQRGGFEIVSQERLRVNTADQEIASVKYSTFVGNDGSANKYYFDASNPVYAPTLNFIAGFTYVFDQTNFTNEFYPNAEGGALNQHPLNFSQTANGTLGGGAQYLDNVIYILDGAEVTSDVYVTKFASSTERKVLITVTASTPSTLYYYCSAHTGMGGEIAVGLPGSGGASGGASITASDSAPSDPTAGALWYNSATGFLFVYVDDGDSQQWVQPVAGNVFSGAYADLIGAPTLASVASTGAYSDLSGTPTVPSVIGDLTDVDTTSVVPTDGQALVWDNANSKWEPGTVAGGSSFDQTLNTTDAVTFSSVTSASILTTGTGVTNFTSATSLTLSATDGVFISGLARSSEVITSLTGATSVVDHSLNLSSVWYHSSIASNFTANFTNVPTVNNRAISVALILIQGATPYIPNAVQVNGSATSINWEDGSAPSGNASKTDVVVFTITRVGGVYSVLGSLTTYG